jgi:hypothetical protein
VAATLTPDQQADPAPVRLAGGEIRWCLVYALVLGAATSVPYLVGASGQTADWSFTGSVVAVEDGNSYLAKMLAGKQGEWLFRSPYSSLSQRGVLAFLPYLIAGKLTDGSHAQLVLAFHLMRLACIPLLVLAVYRFAARFIGSAAWRKWITVLVTAGGGLGWLMIALGKPDLLGSLPLEFYSPETFGFLAVLGFPHLILARAGMFWSLDLYLGRPTGWAAGGVLLLTAILHSPILIPALAALAAHQFALLATGVDWPAWRRRFGAVILLVLPLLIYLGAALATDPYLQGWAEQNRIRSPHPLHYLLAYGAILPAAVLGARRVIQRSNPSGLLPVGWAAVLPFLAYAPVDLQRRLTEGGWVALLVLAAIGLSPSWTGVVQRAVRTGPEFAAPPVSNASGELRQERGWRVVLAVMLLPGSILLLATAVFNVREPAEPLFRTASEVDAFNWLAENAPPGSVVLAAFQTSNALPAWAPMTVVAGHGPESVGLAELAPELRSFFSTDSTEPFRRQFLVAHSVDYVVWGPAERALGKWDPASWECMRPVFDHRGVQLFAVCDG